MWILMNESYFSIVKNKNKKDSLLVRARVKGDIEKVFPKAHVIENAGTDYKYRTFLPKWVVSKAIKKSIEQIDYDNFKNSVPLEDTARHDVYFDVWLNLLALQEPTNRFPSEWGLDKNFVAAETHTVGYQLTKTIMKDEYIPEKSLILGV